MKFKLLLLTFTSAALFLSISCSKAESYHEPEFPTNDEEELEPGEMYDWEKSRTAIPTTTDLVLIYGGSHHRSPVDWTTAMLQDYVAYTDTEATTHWLFDGFLFLEFMEVGTGGAGKTYVTGYTYNGQQLPSANQSDWSYLISYYFQSGTGLDALEQAVGNTANKLGTPARKRRVVIGIPEPIANLNSWQTNSSTTYWGAVNGKTLDFSVTADRAAACQWYIDRVRAEFNKKQYKNIELAGFYWVAEKATQTGTVMPVIAKYLDAMKYSFNWIPYYTAAGYNFWKDYGFHYAYLQPNYFFNESVPYSRLNDACDAAIKEGMEMEMEFDGNALASNGRGSRLRDYMAVFKARDVWATKRLAYYQGSTALRWLQYSSNAEDQALYHEFCQFVITRPLRDTH